MSSLKYVRYLPTCFEYDLGFANNVFKPLNKEYHKYAIIYLLISST